MFPNYPYSKALIVRLVRDAALRRQRDFAADARACVERLRPPLRVLGAQRIPFHRAYVITPNHYYRPGYAAQWTALAISACVPAPVHWIMTAELTFPGRWYASLAMPIWRLLLHRLAGVYGFTAMPPMPPRPRDLQARAAAVHSVLRYVERTGRPIIGLAPEGGDQPGGRLCMPPAGLGRFCLLLAQRGLQFVPVGVHENAGELTLKFGAAYDLCAVPAATSEVRDFSAAYTVMEHIAPLLPIELRGEFRKEASG